MTLKRFRKQLMGYGISRNDANEAVKQIAKLLNSNYNFGYDVHTYNYLAWLARQIKANPDTPVWVLV